MAQIGTFTRNEDGSFAGVIKTLNLSVKARLVVAEKDSEKSPDLRALVGNIETSISIAKSIDRMREVNFLFILVSSFLVLDMKRASPFRVRLQFLDGS